MKPRQFNERRFQRWYGKRAEQGGLDPNPDHPAHQYNYRGAFSAGAEPTQTPQGLKWPSQFKDRDHPNRYIDGQDTITGQPMRGDYILKGLLR